MTELFKKPWQVLWVGDAYRVFDADGRHLFVISSDEVLDEDEKPEDATVLGYGSDDEQRELRNSIEQLFEEPTDG